MNLQPINTFLDPPPSPVLRPQIAVISQVQKFDFCLEQPEFQLKEQQTQTQLIQDIIANELDSTQMIDQEDCQSSDQGKRSYRQFMGKNYDRVTISNAITFVHQRPRKRIHA